MLQAEGKQLTARWKLGSAIDQLRRAATHREGCRKADAEKRCAKSHAVCEWMVAEHVGLVLSTRR